MTVQFPWELSSNLAQYADAESLVRHHTYVTVTVSNTKCAGRLLPGSLVTEPEKCEHAKKVCDCGPNPVTQTVCEEYCQNRYPKR